MAHMMNEASGCISRTLVSVVIPIYNAEKYLDQCLMSVRGQTHTHLEIICINDGSTDDSLAIIRRHATEDLRIRIIDKENGGYGAGCNRGLAEAHGEWIAIVEPDDWIESDMFADMLSFAARFEQQIDIIKTPWWYINDWDRPEQKQSRTVCPLMYSVPRSLRPFKLEERPELIEGHPAIWSALYRKDFLDRANIRFLEFPGAGWADNPFLIDTLFQAESILFLDKAYYCYRADLPGSTRNHSSDAAVVLPFERWLGMLSQIEDLGIRDMGILESHYVRGFMYADGAIYDDGRDNPLVQEGLSRVFSAMDPDIVLNSVKISSKRKKLFCDVCGIDRPRRMSVRRVEYAIRDLWPRLRALGVRGVAKRICFRLTGIR